MLITVEIWSFLGSLAVAICTLAGVIYSSKRAQDRSEAIQDAKIERIEELNKMSFNQIEEKIVTLTKAQEKHNSTIERTYALEKLQAEASRDIKTLYNNLDEVKSDLRDVKTDIDDINKNVSEIKASEIRLEGKLE